MRSFQLRQTRGDQKPDVVARVMDFLEKMFRWDLPQRESTPVRSNGAITELLIARRPCAPCKEANSQRHRQSQSQSKRAMVEMETGNSTAVHELNWQG